MTGLCRRAQIQQVGESRILWRRQEFATLLNVVEDSRDPEHLTTSFELVQSVRRVGLARAHQLP